MTTIPHLTTDIPDILPIHRFSTADYIGMIERGVLGRKDKVELIGGVIVEMSPQGTRHNHFLMQLTRIFAPLMDRMTVAVQATVKISEGAVFDPDILLLKKRDNEYKTRHPTADDIMLVVEAAESSMPRDQKVKLPVYAAAGIQEYWIADLEREVLIIHRDPREIAYETVETRSGDEIVSPLAAPELSFAVHQAFD